MAVGKFALPAGGDGGGSTGISPYAISNSGTQMVCVANVWSNPDVTYAYNVGPTANHSFIQMASASLYTPQVFAIKSDGTLWYYIGNIGVLNSSVFTADYTWRQYGSDTNWTSITGGYDFFAAVKGGNTMFIGIGGDSQRGDGSTATASNWVTTNSAMTWTSVYATRFMCWAINSDGHAYSCGRGYDYQTGLNTGSSVSTWTREKSSLTNVVQISFGRRCTMIRLSNGDVYFTGNNSNGHAGPLMASNNAVNGPTLAVNSSVHYSASFISNFSADGGCHIDSDGFLRFHGEGQNLLRPDNSVTDAKFGSSGLKLTSVGSGWTYYNSNVGNDDNATHPGLAVKDGVMYIGGTGYIGMKRSLSVTDNNLWHATSATPSVICKQSNNLLGLSS